MGFVDDAIAAGYVGYRGWSDVGAANDFAATGGAGKAPGGGGDGGGGGNAGTAPFQFDWEQAEIDALEKLRPYYEEVLEEANFDIDRAKKIMEEDYQSGTRYREEDLRVEQEGFALAEPRESSGLLEDLNRRGFLKSTVRTKDEALLTENQQRRREAVERATRRRQEIAGTERKRGIEELDIKLPRYTRDLGEEKKERAVSLAGIKYGKDQAKFLAETSRFIT